jgi:predicted ATPase
MRELDFEPEMVGRDNELKELEERLDRAAKGEGSTLIISGEAGIGKTRLIDELKSVAQSKGFKILSGNSLYESLTPYMPFIEALISGDMENLFAEAAPKVEAVYIVTDTGLLIKEALREETELDPELFTAMLTTVGNFVKDSLSMLNGREKKGALNILGYENYRILIECGTQTILVVILTGIENEFLINDMKELLINVNNQYGNVLKRWDGDGASVIGIEKLMQPLITSGKYDGIYYGKGDPRTRRNLLFENVSLGLIRHATQKPTLICIEDLQWADPSSLALMHYVARNTKRSGLVILGTYRLEDVTVKEGMTHPLIERMQLMSREDLYEPIELRRLSEENIVSVVQSQFGEIELSEEFKNRIFKETEGNPLFVIELLKLLVDEEIIDRDDGTWKLIKSLEEVNVPSKIYDVIARRLGRVEKKHRKILDYASVVGDEFTSELLSVVLDVSRVEVLEDLRTLEQKHRLIHTFNGNYRFDHAKIREVLYDEIPQELKIEYHAIIGGAIESQNKDDLDSVVGNLAYHYYRCKDKAKALTYLVKAAEKAKKEYSNEEAIRFYNKALEFEEDAQKRIEIFVVLGDIYEVIGEYDKSIVFYESALELAKDNKKRARIKSKISETIRLKGEHSKSIRIATEVLVILRGEGSKSEAGTFGTIGLIYNSKGEYSRALDCFEKGLEIRKKIDDQKGIAHTLNNIGMVHMDRGDYDKAVEFQEKSLGIFEKIGNQRGIATVLNNIGIVQLNKGENDRALECHKRSLKIREKIGALQGISASHTNIGNVYSYRGEYDKGLEYYRKDLEVKEKLGDQLGIVASLINIGNVYRLKGEHDKALEYLGKGLKISTKTDRQPIVGMCLCNIGIVQSNKGEYDSALEHFEKSLKILKKTGDKRPMTYDYCGIAEIYLKKNDFQKALDFCNQALDLSMEISYKNNIALSKRVFGKIYCQQKKWEKSIENFEESIRIFKEIRMQKELAESYYEFGLMWKAKGDIVNAKEQLNKALDIFEKLKLYNMIDKARAELKALR